MTERALAWVVGAVDGPMEVLVTRLAGEVEFLCREAAEVVRLAAVVDAAIVVVPAGRDAALNGGRDHVVAGCEILVGQLGPDRVCVVSGPAAALPVTLEGITGIEAPAGGEIEACLDRLRTFVAASSRIRYRTNWLARYEFGLDLEDALLKHREAAQLEAVLRGNGRWGRIGALLDVGTCTGRYPLLLRDAVRPDGVIVGLDCDAECVEFARGKAARSAPDDARIEWLCADFAAATLAAPRAPFDLISCMMSTISHFGRGRQPAGDDALQRMLERCHRLLTPGGLLVLSVWSRQALDAGNLLAIYDETDCRKLAAWTPDSSELDRRLAAAGFGRRERSRPDPRLDLWVCERASR
jgi:SAM-dependent methyltransferase